MCTSKCNYSLLYKVERKITFALLLFTDGIITMRDLAEYTADWVEPISGTLQNGDYDIISPPPPSSGVVLQLILKILDGKN